MRACPFHAEKGTGRSDVQRPKAKTYKLVADALLTLLLFLFLRGIFPLTNVLADLLRKLFLVHFGRKCSQRLKAGRSVLTQTQTQTHLKNLPGQISVCTFANISNLISTMHTFVDMSMKQREGDFKFKSPSLCFIFQISNQKCVFAVGKPSFDIDDAFCDSFGMLQHLHCVLDLL